MFERGGSSPVGAVLLLLAAGCDSGGPRADAPRSAPPGRPASLETLPAIDLRPGARIDGHEQDLVSVGWMGVAPDGTVALLQGQDGEIRFFDPDGRPLARVGGRGQGPGEFERPVRGGWKGDTLWISDTGLSRVTLISPDPEFARVMPPLASARPTPADSAELPTFGFVFPYALYPGDTLLVLALGSAGDPKAETLPGSPLLRVTHDGRIQDVVMFRARRDGAVTGSLAGGGSWSVTVPFFPDPHWTVSPDGSRVATLETELEGVDGSYTVRVLSARGDTVWSRRMPFEGVPIPRSVVDSVLAARVEGASRPEMRQAYEDEVPGLIPPVYPPVVDLRLDVDGRAWIGLREVAEGRPWMVMDPEGTLLGVAMLPGDTRFGAARDDALWVVRTDELGVQSAVGYRMSGRPVP